MVQGIKSGKRKARSEEGEEASVSSKAAGQPRKAVKRAQGHTPSRKGPAPGLKGQSPAHKGHGPSPLRHLNGGRGAQGPSRLAHSTHVSDIENAAKLANSSDQVVCDALLHAACGQDQKPCVQFLCPMYHEITMQVLLTTLVATAVSQSHLQVKKLVSQSQHTLCVHLCTEG